MSAVANDEPYLSLDAKYSPAASGLINSQPRNPLTNLELCHYSSDTSAIVLHNPVV